MLKKAPIYLQSHPAAKHPKFSKFSTTDTREKPVYFLLYDTGDADFNPRNNFANLSSFCKSFCSCRICNYLITLWSILCQSFGDILQLFQMSKKMFILSLSFYNQYIVELLSFVRMVYHSFQLSCGVRIVIPCSWVGNS